MSAVELTIPRFVLCEIPIKEGTNLDNRSWIYCPNALSLIEVIPEDEITAAINRNLDQKRYHYTNPDGVQETFLLVMAQNNCELTQLLPGKLLDAAWTWYREYLAWEDEHIDGSRSAREN